MKKLSYIFLTFIIASGIFYIFYKSHSDKTEIKTHPGKTICKYTFCTKYGKPPHTAFVKYVIDNKLYRTRAGDCPENSKNKINKYFWMKYSTIDPNKIEVDFSTEVKDKTEIEYLELKLKNWFDLE